MARRVSDSYKLGDKRNVAVSDTPTNELTRKELVEQLELFGKPTDGPRSALITRLEAARAAALLKQSAAGTPQEERKRRIAERQKKRQRKLSMSQSRAMLEREKANSAKHAQQHSEAERKGLMRAFQKLDKNGDGVLSEDEFRDAMINHGVGLSESQFKEMMLIADVDGDGMVDLKEFCAVMLGDSEEAHMGLMVTSALLANKRELRLLVGELFEATDVDNDGSLSKEELEPALNSIFDDLAPGLHARTPSIHCIDEVFAKYDKNGDGVLCKKEFTECVEDVLKTYKHALEGFV